MKFKLSWIHAEALIVYLIYTLGTKYVFFQSLLWRNEFRYYVPGPLISAFFGIIFLYFFSHEDFFKFAREVERREKKNEQKWLHKLIHFGKILTVFLVVTLSGPLLAALATRFLFKNTNTRYLVILLASVFGSLITLLIFKEGLSFFIWH